jgi:hypothetical protein
MPGLGLGLRLGSRMTRGASGFDSDAQTFINANIAAGGTLSAPVQEAINNLFLDLKGEGPNNPTVDLWTTHIKRWFPVVGGVANAHRIDVRLNTGDFMGGVTHSVSGAYTNGTTGYFDPMYAGDDFPNPSIGGFGGYIGATTQPNTDGYFGGVNGSLSTTHAISNSNTGDNTYMDWKGGVNGVIAGDTTGVGAYDTARISATHILCYRNEVGGQQAAVERAGNVTDNIWFGGIDNGGVLILPKANRFQTARITYNLNTTKTALIQHVDNAFQTALWRNAY